MTTTKNIFFYIIVTAVLSAVGSVGLFNLLLNTDRDSSHSENKSEFASNSSYLDYARSYPSAAPTDFIDACRNATPGVVFISSKQKVDFDFFAGARYGESKGSGVLISPKGYIVTNNHVIEGGKDINVTLNDNREYKARIVGIDPSTDLALIKIDEEKLPFIQFGNSDSLHIGEWVLAMGNPFKLQSTVTAGIVSAKARNINILNEQYSVESFIQTDAVVNPGNSGGALVNSLGELVGINTAIITNSGKYEGYSFAIPSNLVQKIVRDLKEYGTVQRGLLGVNIGPVNARLASDLNLPDVSGVYISRVNKNSAAAEADLRRRDVILSINRVSINNMPELQEQVARYRPGDALELQVFRSGKMLTKRVVLKNQINTTEVISAFKHETLSDIGVEARNLTQSETDRLGTSGVKVLSILRSSPMDRANMEPGFIILKLNDDPVTDAEELVEKIQDNRGMIILEGFYESHPDTYWYTFKN